uniref:Phage tail tape measure protein n=1 Tax=Caulobacter sp. (strain K31) TaxID=366602 RepID=B0SVY8_CAUSK
MSDFNPDGLDAVPARAAEAAAAIAALKAPAEQAARSIDDAFAKAGTRLARSLAHAADDGKVSLGELARAVLEAVAAGVGGGAGGGLANALSSAVGGLFSGARADGGAVAAGGAYLVGERGPEVFRPTTGGAIEPMGGGGVKVTVNVQGGDTASLARSDAQLAQALARAVSLGARRL